MQQRRIRALVTTCVVLAVVGAGVWWAVARFGSFDDGPECTIPRGEARLGLTAAQLQHASTINAVGLHRQVPERGRVIAVATAYQESSLRNIDHGDLDSLGLFQQRPSQGWGTAAEIMDPVYAAGAFYDALLAVPDWQTRPLTEAAQAVQRSAFPDAYARWEDDARTLVTELSGTQRLGLRCRADALASTAAAPVREEVPTPPQASAALRTALAQLAAELGNVTVGEVADDGDEATIRVAVPGLDSDRAARATAAWLVAHGASQRLTWVAVSDRRFADGRWDAAEAAPAPGTVRFRVAEPPR